MKNDKEKDREIEHVCTHIQEKNWLKEVRDTKKENNMEDTAMECISLLLHFWLVFIL